MILRGEATRKHGDKLEFSTKRSSKACSGERPGKSRWWLQPCGCDSDIRRVPFAVVRALRAPPVPARSTQSEAAANTLCANCARPLIQRRALRFPPPYAGVKASPPPLPPSIATNQNTRESGRKEDGGAGPAYGAGQQFTLRSLRRAPSEPCSAAVGSVRSALVKHGALSAWTECQRGMKFCVQQNMGLLLCRICITDLSVRLELLRINEITACPVMLICCGSSSSCLVWPTLKGHNAEQEQGIPLGKKNPKFSKWTKPQSSTHPELPASVRTGVCKALHRTPIVLQIPHRFHIILISRDELLFLTLELSQKLSGQSAFRINWNC